MILSEFISYKCAYYFLKDDSLENYLEFYKDISDEYKEFKDNGYKEKEFYDIYSKVRSGTSDIVLLKTKYGSIVFHDFTNHAHVKKFLINNSKKAPCAFFATHRVSETHYIGLASEGKLSRYVYYGEDEHILEGNPSEYEIKNNLNWELDEDGFFIESIDESNVYDCASDFIGFDRDEDIEILDFKYYKFDPYREHSKYESKIENNIINLIHENLNRQGFEDGFFYITTYRDDPMYQISFVGKENDEFYYVFCKHLNTLKNKKIFKESLFECLNAMASEDYKNCTKVTFEHYLYEDVKKKFNHNMYIGLIDNEYRNELTFSLVVKDTVKLSEEEVIKRQITIKDFKPKNYKTIYKYINSMVD